MKLLNQLLLEGNRNFDLFDHSIILGYMGSISHGTYKSNSIDDKDVMGVVMLPAEYIYGLKQFGSRNTLELKKDYWDVVIYGLKKYVSLLTKNNPNVMGLLWLEKKEYIRLTEYGEISIANREVFSSKLAYNSFCGYAYSQLKKLEGGFYQGYMGEKRKKLVDKIGYDPKNASHLIRLLRMGIEFLETGIVNVKRKDASVLIEIKEGKWKIGKVKSEADRLFKKLETAKNKCELPDRPDYEKINKLLIHMYDWKFNK